MRYGKRDKRYLLTRRYSTYSRTPSQFFQRTDPDGLKWLDEPTRHADAPIKPLFSWWHEAMLYGMWVIALALLFVAIFVDPPRPSQVTLDAAAAQRAEAFVSALGFEPGPAVCRAKRDGSAWCTIRISGSDKTFALWCSDEHPNCIERGEE
jgi:hypothetical protein